MIEALFKRFPSFQKVGAGAYKPGIANMEFADQLLKPRIAHPPVAAVRLVGNHDLRTVVQAWRLTEDIPFPIGGKPGLSVRRVDVHHATAGPGVDVQLEPRGQVSRQLHLGQFGDGQDLCFSVFLRAGEAQA